jgi:hypothetical protein
MSLLISFIYNLVFQIFVNGSVCHALFGFLGCSFLVGNAVHAERVTGLHTRATLAFDAISGMALDNIPSFRVTVTAEVSETSSYAGVTYAKSSSAKGSTISSYCNQGRSGRTSYYTCASGPDTPDWVGTEGQLFVFATAPWQANCCYYTAKDFIESNEYVDLIILNGNILGTFCNPALDLGCLY